MISIVQIFVGVEPGLRIDRAIQRAKDSGCDFILFNDRLIPCKDDDWEQMDCPIVTKDFLLRRQKV